MQVFVNDYETGKQCEIISLDLMEEELVIRPVGEHEVLYRGFNDIQALEDIKLTKVCDN